MREARKSSVAVYDGREHIADITDDGAGCTLRDAAGRLVGRYANRVEAMRALRSLSAPVRAEEGR